MKKENVRIQDMLLQDMALWHTEYFKLKEFEKQHVQGELSDIPLKKILRPLHERYPSYTWKDISEGLKESEETGFTKFPLVYYT